VGLKSLKSLNLTNGYPNKNKKNKNNNNNKVKSKPLELFELAGKKQQQRKKERELFSTKRRCSLMCSLDCKLINISVTICRKCGV
jgi:hypothetical protein